MSISSVPPYHTVLLDTSPDFYIKHCIRSQPKCQYYQDQVLGFIEEPTSVKRALEELKANVSPAGEWLEAPVLDTVSLVVA